MDGDFLRWSFGCRVSRAGFFAAIPQAEFARTRLSALRRQQPSFPRRLVLVFSGGLLWRKMFSDWLHLLKGFRTPPYGGLLTIALALVGCTDNRSAKSPEQKNHDLALYGAPAGIPSISIERVRPMGEEAAGWENAPFFYVQTELSPMTWFHSATRYLGLFTHLS